MSRRWNKNDDSAAGHGARQRPAMLISSRRYRDRLAGVVPPLELKPLSEIVI